MNPTDDLRAFRLAPLALLAVAAFAAGCAGDPPTSIGAQCQQQEEDESTDPPAPSPVPEEQQDDNPTNDQSLGPTESADPENTFEHPGDLDGSSRDPFDILAQREEEGPPEVRTRLHSCQR
jgi:hypothetical protein